MTRRRIASSLQRGFTLAEILVTTAIFAIIMIAALTVYDRSNRVFKTGTEAADLQQSTRIGFDKLVSDLRMAGFDANRGGTPTGDGQYAQPDEQIEYAGPTAVAFRANFNYNSAAAQGNGLEPDYTPKDSKGSPIFPYVTTSNDEIVIYALKSADSTKNTSSISFWADVAKPRAAYPPAGKESVVTVSGIDTTNDNPPYTLYRITVADVLAGRAGVPVAENIRSLHFFYYTDPKGTALLKNGAADITTGHDASGSTFPTTFTVTLPDGTSTTYNTGAIGGDGQYDAKNSATVNVDDRSQRAILQSVKVDLTGINANPDAAYTNPTETIAPLKSYRQYRLSALVVPRNFGLTGFPEPSYTPPGPPTITGMCVSACAAPVICWSPPSTGGPVSQYRIEWDTQVSGAFSNALVITDPTQVTATVPDDGVMDPSVTWYFHIIAQNDNGASVPSDLFSVIPKNATRPAPPGGVAASTATRPNAQDPTNTNYVIALQWTAPSTNDPAKSGVTCSGAGCSTDGAAIPPQENIRFRVARGLASAFDPAKNEGVIILDTATKGQPGPLAPGSSVAWQDAPKASLFPPGTCVPYYYRVQAVDRCASNPAYNASGKTTDSVSDWSPAWPAAGQGGQAYDAGAAVQAAAPTLSIDNSKSLCGASGNCTIVLNWSAVTTDNAGNAIGVDKYRITRYKKIVTDTSYTLDTTFGTNGNFDLSGASQSNSGTVSYTDSTAPAIDSVSKLPLYYKYTVAANDCRIGVVSDPAYFPAPCTIGPNITPQGQSGGTGDTPQSPWVFNGGDTITVTPPLSGGITIKTVAFDVFAWPAMTSVDSQSVSAAPFRYAWSDRTDGTVYYVRITVTSSTGCVETQVRYVQDQQGAPCSFVNQTPPTPSNNGTTGVVTSSQDFTITNSGAETMTLASKSINITWADPDGKHPDMTLISVVFGTPVVGKPPKQTGGYLSTVPLAPADKSGSVTIAFPSDMPQITPTGVFTMSVKFQYTATTGNGSNKTDVDPPLTATPLKKICLDYNVPSETTTKHCNLVGQSATTNNPTTCD
jgi:prepilin-type N-terminal cleavage/methylation domain-containing protein